MKEQNKNGRRIKEEKSVEKQFYNKRKQLYDG
jgi:hypothetical protein